MCAPARPCGVRGDLNAVPDKHSSAPSLDTSRGHATPSPVPTSAFIEATPDSPLNVRGIFVYAAGDGNLSRQDAETDAPVPLVETPKTLSRAFPRFCPMGNESLIRRCCSCQMEICAAMCAWWIWMEGVNTLLEADATELSICIRALRRRKDADYAQRKRKRLTNRPGWNG